MATSPAAGGLLGNPFAGLKFESPTASPVTSSLRPVASHGKRTAAAVSQPLLEPEQPCGTLDTAALSRVQIQKARNLPPEATATLTVSGLKEEEPWQTAVPMWQKSAQLRRDALQKQAMAAASSEQEALKEKRRVAVEEAVNERRFDAGLPPLIDRRIPKPERPTSARPKTAGAIARPTTVAKAAAAALVNTPLAAAVTGCPYDLPEPEPEPEAPPKPVGHWLWKFRKFPERSPLRISDVEDDILLDILGSLAGRQLGRVGRTCRAWRDLMLDPLANEMLWKHVQLGSGLHGAIPGGGARLPHSPTAQSHASRPGATRTLRLRKSTTTGKRGGSSVRSGTAITAP